MHRVLKKEQIFTIPNFLSMIRLAMIPIIVWLYCRQQAYPAAVAVIVLSGITDIADGIIARKFHMVSDFGKILDPIADKLTQAALIICLTSKYKLMVPLIIEFIVREFIMLILGYVTIKKKDAVNSSQWFGKLTTVALYAVMVILILFPGIPLWAANTLIVICGTIMLLSFIGYARFYWKFLSQKKDTYQTGQN